MSAITDAYFADVISRLETLKKALALPMAQATQAVLQVAQEERRVYVFGTGHSHMLAEEVHYRAGGLAFVVPVLVSSAMLHEGAVVTSLYERTPGLIRHVLERYGMQKGDVLIIASNSGVNAAPVEAADYGHEIGATVIAVTSVAYSQAIANGRRYLADIADIVLDNGAPPGDAVLTLPATDLKVGPVSTVMGATVLNAVFADVASQLSASANAPIYLSSNMPGANAVNGELVKKYRPRNPHL